MKNKSNMKESSFVLKYSKLVIIMIYNLVLVSVGIVFYYLIPILLNYDPERRQVEKMLGSPSYLTQFVIVLGFSVIVGTIILLRALSGIGKWDKAIGGSAIVSQKKVAALRVKCINLPYHIYIAQMTIIIGPIAIYLVAQTLINQTTLTFIPKLLVLVFSYVSLLGILSLLFSKAVFSQILRRTFKDEGLQGRRIGIKGKIFLQMIPLIIIALLFTSLIGYSKLISEKGDILYKIYYNKLETTFKDINSDINLEKLQALLKSVALENNNDSTFISTPEGKIIASNGIQLGIVFPMYINGLSDKHKGHLYSDDGEVQGVVLKIQGDNGLWKVGVKYNVVSEDAYTYFLISFSILLFLNIFVLYYFSRSISADIAQIAESLSEIAEGEEVDLDKKIPITSNDEIADLVIAFNKILDREKEHIAEVEEKQKIMSEQDRLASLGQLIGGIAHNLRTPIMSISGGIEGLKDLINEYHDSIGDNTITDDDHFEIIKEMRTWIEKMRPYCSYMSDIITAVKDQTAKPSTETGITFTIEELERRIDILLDHELRKRRCRLVMDINILKSTLVPGEISNLVQVLNNLIVNAAHAYETKGGDIEMKVDKKGNDIVFSIKDSGVGIPKEIQDSLFKEMVTTKGKKGTGLGLYMSYSNIKARFGGNMWFESEKGKGTTFYVSIPLKNA